MNWARLHIAAASRNCSPFYTAAPSELYQQSLYAKRCTAPCCAAILLRPDMPKFPASRSHPRSGSSTSARPLLATNPVVEKDKRTVQTVCVADCTVSVCAADGLKSSERSGSGESLRLYQKFSFSLKDFIAADLQTPLFLLSNKRVLVSRGVFPPAYCGFCMSLLVIRLLRICRSSQVGKRISGGSRYGVNELRERYIAFRQTFSRMRREGDFHLAVYI